jgi:hypothetical protein
MALFNLTGITMNPSDRTGVYASQATISNRDTNDSARYNSNIYRYPSDIGSMDKGHYIVIHINEQMHTSYGGNGTMDDPTVIANRKLYGTPTLNSAADSIQKNDYVQDLGAGVNTVLSEGISGTANLVDTYLPKYAEGIKNAGANVRDVVAAMVAPAAQAAKNYTQLNGVRTIKRTSDTIALYMPDTLNFTSNQGYSEPSQQGIPATALSMGGSLAQSLKKGNNSGLDFAKALATNMTPFMASLGLEKFGGFGQTAFAAGFGVVKNPMIELLYSTPEFRNFRFDFMLYPRSKKEAEEVLNILNRLKFHQAPELRKDFTSYFLVPPSEFDIKFYYNGEINPNIPEISTCVLTTIDIDYAPNGFSAYEVPGETTATPGGTGMPVAIRLGLGFKETEIMTKDNFAKDANRIKRGSVPAFSGVY